MQNNIRKIDGVYLTEVMTFPRSGHHWLMGLLRDYLGERYHYCEMYKEPHLKIAVCEQTNIQKNHDLKLDTPVLEDRKYLVQVRDPLESLQSRWLLSLESGKTKLVDTEECWRKTMKAWLPYYAEFVSRWIYSPVPNRLVLRYRDLLYSPIDRVRAVLKHIDTQPVDERRLAYALDAHPPSFKSHKILQYDYLPYDKVTAR